MEADEEQKQLQIPSSRSLPPAAGLAPWLVFFHGRRGQNQTFYSLSEKRYHVKNIPDMRRKRITTSSHGWVVLIGMYSDDCDFFLLNPITMDKIQLPPYDSFIYTGCVLSSPPNDPNCIVFFLGNGRKGLVSVMFCHPGDRDWVTQDIEMEEDSISEVVCFGGEIDGLTTFQSKLVIFDVGTTLTIREIVGEALPKPLSPEAYMIKVHMVESCGELFVFKRIYLGWMEIIENIEVFKIDFSRKAWMRVESFRDRVFFLGPFSCTSCSAKELGIKGDTIYFTSPEDRTLYAFNHEDKSMTITLPCPNIKDHWYQPEWVLPLV